MYLIRKLFKENSYFCFLDIKVPCYQRDSKIVRHKLFVKESEF